MKARLKQFYKAINISHPYAAYLIRKIYYRKPFNNVKRVVRGSDNRIEYKYSILTSVFFDIQGNRNTIEIGEDCLLNGVTFSIRGDDHRVIINKGVKFSRGGSIWFEDNNCSLLIGKNSTFEDVHLALTEPYSQISIGQDCMFAYDIDVRTGDSHSIFSVESNERINYAEDVVIGNHVWIAAHSILLKGTVIPDGAIVATGSVVTRKFDTTGIVIGGNPASLLKEGVAWTRQRIYKPKNM